MRMGIQYALPLAFDNPAACPCHGKRSDQDQNPISRVWRDGEITGNHGGRNSEGRQEPDSLEKFPLETVLSAQALGVVRLRLPGKENHP